MDIQHSALRISNRLLRHSTRIFGNLMQIRHWILVYFQGNTDLCNTRSRHCIELCRFRPRQCLDLSPSPDRTPGTPEDRLLFVGRSFGFFKRLRKIFNFPSWVKQSTSAITGNGADVMSFGACHAKDHAPHEEKFRPPVSWHPIRFADVSKTHGCTSSLGSGGNGIQ